MKRILLATAASLALSLPAMAAPPANSNTAPPPQHQTNQMNNNKQAQPAPKSNMNRQANEQQRISPRRLSKQQIMNIQQALNKKGFSAGHVDGRWGRTTDTALRDFQKKQKLPGNGHLNRQTLAALGVHFTPKAERSTVGSGSSATGSKTTNHMSNSKTMNHMNKSSSEMNQKK